MSPEALPRYAEVAPPGALRPWVACLWQIQGEPPPGAPAFHRILPDGCMDVVVDAGTSAARIVGPMSVATGIVLSGRIDLVGLRLRPGGQGLVGALAASELLDATIEPAAAGPAVRGRSGALARAVEGSPDVGARARRVWAILLQLAARAPERDPLLVHALSRWSAPTGGPPAATVGALLRDVGVSERTLERRFLRAAGYRPAELRRLARFRRVLRLRAGGEERWSALAAEAGYADQAHLVREFRGFAGVTPTGWAGEQARAGFVQDGTISAL